MKASSIGGKSARDAWPQLCALALALAIAGCGTTGGHVSTETVGTSDASAVEVENDARGSAIGKVAEAGARGIGGAALGVIAGAFRGLQCGLLAPICVPISAVVHGVVLGSQAIAATPGLGDAIGNTTSDGESSRSSAEVASPTTASEPDVRTDPSDVETPSRGTQSSETTSDDDASRSSSELASSTPMSAPELRPEASDVAIGSHGMHRGDRWEYRYVDSRKRQSGTRSFEVVQLSSSIVREQIALEDGRTISAEHHGGAYLSMVGGMQFAPYYFAFRSDGAPRSLDTVRVEGGDACEAALRSVYNSYDCEVSAEFQGSERVTVPAGTFEAERVRVQVYRRVWGSWGGQPSGVIAVGQFWFSREAGRVVNAEVKFDLARPWTESMELVSAPARYPLVDSTQ
jgi:hypothetical protein